MRKLVVATNALLAILWFGPAISGGSAGVELQSAQKTAAGNAALTSEAVDNLLAPIALYPDALLGNMLLCAVNPGKVGALNEWLNSHQTLTGSALQDAAKASGFDESFVAIAVLPDVVNTMASRIDWTTSVGRAFETDKSAVFASIQRLRTKARDAGKLKSTPQQEVESRTTSTGQQVIVIEPANPQVVYVPQYNPETVYVPTTTSNTVVITEDDDADEAVAAGLIGFTAGIALGAAIDNDYYYGPYGWGGGFYMYDDAWDDWSDHREDAREDWQDHREDLTDERGERRENVAEERGERAGTTQEERTERQQSRQENRPESSAQREQRRTEAQSTVQSRTGSTSQEARGYSRDSAQTTRERSGTGSDAFSGYSSGRSERAASQRGQRSRSSRGGGRR